MMLNPAKAMRLLHFRILIDQNEIDKNICSVPIAVINEQFIRVIL